ncbi:MFS general substrate transporter [Schizopora paradoxa]|uniref:MFS general substrate transporter n=1 Tax=Schizopora paradoxa TaxID=27342 RepID=A0A0H2RGH5_9AGAM|nr:MFS general substrate transporter [Schizopora paradoxa]
MSDIEANADLPVVAHDDSVNSEVKESSESAASVAVGDIEHMPVRDDPRAWSRTRKNTILAIVASAAMIATLGANIYNPAINEIKEDLHTTDADIALTLSVFIFVQGAAPLFWSAVSEIKGRKIVYLTSELTFVVGCIIVATAKSIAVVISMRCLQAFGASAVLSIGAATLADIYEPHERGTMMGIYYAAPLLGPSLGPLLGGVLTQIFSWRATFYFLAIFGGVSLTTFVFFKDTFRRERSLAYQAALKRALYQSQKKGTNDNASQASCAENDKQPCNNEKTTSEATYTTKQDIHSVRELPKFNKVKLSLRDVNPLTPLLQILKRTNNIVILFASGFMFAFSYCIAYTCSRTFSSKYHYDALQIGLVLLSFGIGCVSGSILGGRWSDRTLRKLKAANGGQSSAEMRLQSTMPAMLFMPLSSIAYGWLCEKHIHVAAVCAALFLCGFFSIWIYSSTLAYIVDANTGRSSTAVASNSCFRGIYGFIIAEIAAPVQNAIGDGGLYTIWAGLMVITEILILLVWWKGAQWRERAIAKEALRQGRL